MRQFGELEAVIMNRLWAEPLGRVRRHLLRAAAAGLALVPLLLALTPAVVALALGRVQPA